MVQSIILSKRFFIATITVLETNYLYKPNFIINKVVVACFLILYKFLNPAPPLKGLLKYDATDKEPKKQ